MPSPFALVTTGSIVVNLDAVSGGINFDNLKIGLEKGNLTDSEIATKVAREFFEALIAEDYEKAGLLYEGIPAKKMKEVYGRFKFYRIVEIGKPIAGVGVHPDKTQVPVKVEWEGTAGKEVKQFDPYIRAVYGHPDRWGISGGI